MSKVWFGLLCVVVLSVNAFAIDHQYEYCGRFITLSEEAAKKEEAGNPRLADQRESSARYSMYRSHLAKVIQGGLQVEGTDVCALVAKETETYCEACFKEQQKTGDRKCGPDCDNNKTFFKAAVQFGKCVYKISDKAHKQKKGTQNVKVQVTQPVKENPWEAAEKACFKFWLADADKNKTADQKDKGQISQPKAKEVPSKEDKENKDNSGKQSTGT